MKVILGQTNPTPNNYERNTQQIIESINVGFERKAELVVTPETGINGYQSRDLLYNIGYVEEGLKCLTKIVEHTRSCPSVTVIVGYVGFNTTGYGKPFTNMAAVIRGGIIITTYQKQLLPTYDVFDESRWFQPGTDLCVVDIAGQKCGISICEDVWNDKNQDDYLYRTNPVARYRERGIDVLINISASPYAFGKPQKRLAMLKEISKSFSLIYVNQMGGQDELVFDGHSCVLVAGGLAHESWGSFRTVSSNEYVEFTNKPGHYCSSNPYTGIGELSHVVISGLYDYIRKNSFTDVVLGSSGGIDSALVATLACQVIDPSRVHCIMMPSIYSSEGSVADAKQLHKNLGCNEYLVPIEHEPFLNHINKHLGKSEPYYTVADENLQARMRGQIVMHFSNSRGMLALTTGNKTELAVGYCTLYGDMNGGFNPIGDLLKDQVYAMATYLDDYFYHRKCIPTAILKKDPSAELAPGQTDEKSLVPYVILNAIVRSYVECYISKFDEFVKWVNKHHSMEFEQRQSKHLLLDWLEQPSSCDIYDKMIRRINQQEFKRRQAAPTIRVSSKAFGTGRRFPIVQGANSKLGGV